MTPRSDWSKPDFLQQRRLESGVRPEAKDHLPLPQLLLKGSVVGVVLCLFPLLLLPLLEMKQDRLEEEILALAPVEARVGDAQARLNAMAKKSELLNQQTNRIATQLVALRSGSALFEQMRLVTPQGVRFVSVKALPSKLVITGEAEGSDAFKRINALALNLDAQNEIRANGTTVVKATTRDNVLVDFTMQSLIDPSVRPTPERLRELGAEGLARRHEFLRVKGVLF